METESQKRYVHYVEQYLAAPSRLAAAPRRVLQQIVFRNLFAEYLDVPEAVRRL